MDLKHWLLQVAYIVLTFVLLSITFQAVEPSPIFAAAQAASTQQTEFSGPAFAPSAPLAKPAPLQGANSPQDPVDPAQYIGLYTNDTLGYLGLSAGSSSLVATTGGFSSTLQSDGNNTFSFHDEPFAGVTLDFQKDAAGSPQLVMHHGYDLYVFKHINLSTLKPKPFDDTMKAELESYVRDVMERANIPGAAVSIVQDGKVVYSGGFGVREVGKPEPVTPDTRMMIGSVTKGMTTMMAAGLVDEGKFTWDTPVTQFIPTFALSDPTLTPQVTMKKMFCNCTGVPSREVELMLHGGGLAPQDLVRGLKTFPLIKPFGGVYNYSNYMFATGGYAATLAADGDPSHLYESYTALMQKRVFDPIEMPNTTFSFDKALGSGNVATPHALNIVGTNVPLPISNEYFVHSVAPAGAVWSTANDMARYVITQLNRGVAPNGTRVASAKNLETTWVPQVQVAPNNSYALGWGVGDYRGVRLVSHTGGTSGFASEVTFAPDANWGVVVLMNSTAETGFGAAVRVRALELLYGIPREFDLRFNQVMQAHQEGARAVVQALTGPVDVAAVTPYLGTFTNDAVGSLQLTLQDGKLILHTVGFDSELLPARDENGNTVYLEIDPPNAGLPFSLSKDSAGKPIISLTYPPESYVFQKAN